MNYAAILAVLAATAFTLPLLAQLAESLGLPRDLSVALALGVTLAGWRLLHGRLPANALPRDAELSAEGEGTAPPAELEALKEETNASV